MKPAAAMPRNNRRRRNNNNNNNNKKKVPKQQQLNTNSDDGLGDTSSSSVGVTIGIVPEIVLNEIETSVECVVTIEKTEIDNCCKITDESKNIESETLLLNKNSSEFTNVPVINLIVPDENDTTEITTTTCTTTTNNISTEELTPATQEQDELVDLCNHQSQINSTPNTSTGAAVITHCFTYDTENEAATTQQILDDNNLISAESDKNVHTEEPLNFIVESDEIEQFKADIYTYPLYRVESPTKITKPKIKLGTMKKSRSLDDNEMCIQELSDTGSTSGGDNENTPIISEAESEAELDKLDTFEPKTCPLIDVQTIPFSGPMLNLSEQEEQLIQEFIKPSDEEDPNLVRARKKAAIESHFLPQMLHPKYLDVIKEESSDNSDVDTKKVKKYDDMDDDVFLDNDVSKKTNAVFPKSTFDFSVRKKHLTRLRGPAAPAIREEQQCFKLDTKFLEPETIEESCSKWTTSQIGEETCAEVVYIGGSSSSSASDLNDGDIEDSLMDEQINRMETPTIGDISTFSTKPSVVTMPVEFPVVIPTKPDFKIGEPCTNNMFHTNDIKHDTIKTNEFTRQDSAGSVCSSQSHSTSQSQCTARYCNLSPPRDLADFESTSCVSGTAIKPLRQICLDTLTQMPYGSLIIEELAHVAGSLGELTNQHHIKLLNANKMPYPVPDIPFIDDLEVAESKPSVVKLVAIPPAMKSPSPPPIPALPKLQSWLGVPTEHNPNVLVCLSPSQRAYMNENSQTSPDLLLEMHKQFIERRGYHEYSDVQLKAINKISSQSENTIEDDDDATAAKDKSRLLAIIRDTKQLTSDNSTTHSDSTPPTTTTTADKMKENLKTETVNNQNGDKMFSSSVAKETKRFSEDFQKRSEEEFKHVSKEADFQKHFSKDSDFQKQFSKENVFKPILNDTDFQKRFSNDADFEKRFSNIEQFILDNNSMEKPKYYSNIEKSTYETKKRIENGNVVFEFSDSNKEKSTNIDGNKTQERITEHHNGAAATNENMKSETKLDQNILSPPPPLSSSSTNTTTQTQNEHHEIPLANSSKNKTEIKSEKKSTFEENSTSSKCESNPFSFGEFNFFSPTLQLSPPPPPQPPLLPHFDDLFTKSNIFEPINENFPDDFNENIIKPIFKEENLCKGKASNIQVRAPRLIDDHRHYDIFTKTQFHNRQSMIDQTPITQQVPLRRKSLPKELHERQFEYIRHKELELQYEFDKLEQDRRKLMEEIDQMQVNQSFQDFATAHRNEIRSTQTFSNYVSEAERFRQQMHDEWLNKVAEREERRLHKIIKISKSADENGGVEATFSMPICPTIKSTDIGNEFLNRVKERRTKLKMPSDSDWESGAESQPEPRKREDVEVDPTIKVLEGCDEADLQKLPDHIKEFACEFTKTSEQSNYHESTATSTETSKTSTEVAVDGESGDRLFYGFCVAVAFVCWTVFRTITNQR